MCFVTVLSCFKKTLLSFIYRSGVIFTTPENRPTEYPLEDYIYSEKVREIYIDNGNNFDPIIDALIAETSLAVPPNR